MVAIHGLLPVPEWVEAGFEFGEFQLAGGGTVLEFLLLGEVLFFGLLEDGAEFLVAGAVSLFGGGEFLNAGAELSGLSLQVGCAGAALGLLIEEFGEAGLLQAEAALT